MSKQSVRIDYRAFIQAHPYSLALRHGKVIMRVAEYLLFAGPHQLHAHKGAYSLIATQGTLAGGDEVQSDVSGISAVLVLSPKLE